MRGAYTTWHIIYWDPWTKFHILGGKVQIKDFMGCIVSELGVCELEFDVAFAIPSYGDSENMKY